MNDGKNLEGSSYRVIAVSYQRLPEWAEEKYEKKKSVQNIYHSIYNLLRMGVDKSSAFPYLQHNQKNFSCMG
jgi:hypothetical protein